MQGRVPQDGTGLVPYSQGFLVDPALYTDTTQIVLRHDRARMVQEENRQSAKTVPRVVDAAALLWRALAPPPR